MLYHLIVGDDHLFREGLARLIDSFENFKVDKNWSNLKFLEMIKNEENTFKDVDILVMCSPYFMQPRFVKNAKLKKYFGDCSTMILSDEYAKKDVISCLEKGISAYFSRDILPETLEQVLVDLVAEEPYSTIKLEPKIKATLTQDTPAHVSFTPAEEEVLQLVCSQKSSAEISEQLGISVRTVESRKSTMIKKTASKNMIGVIMTYLHQNIIETRPL
jgi:DNA-binding NarL/FixJ family response regulator